MSTIPPPLAQTDRLILRVLCPDDLEFLCEMMADPEVMRYSLRGTLGRADVEEWLCRCIAESAAGRPTFYAVAARESGNPLGYSGFVAYNDPLHRATHEVAYRFHPSAWGKGIGTEAVRLTIDYGFRAFPFPAILAFVDPANTASIRILERCGMHYIRDTNYKHLHVREYILTRPT